MQYHDFGVFGVKIEVNITTSKTGLPLTPEMLEMLDEAFKHLSFAHESSALEEVGMVLGTIHMLGCPTCDQRSVCSERDMFEAVKQCKNIERLKPSMSRAAQ